MRPRESERTENAWPHGFSTWVGRRSQCLSSQTLGVKLTGTGVLGSLHKGHTRGSDSDHANTWPHAGNTLGTAPSD